MCARPRPRPDCCVPEGEDGGGWTHRSAETSSGPISDIHTRTMAVAGWQVSLYLTMRNINEQIWYVGLESVTCFIHTNISYAVFIQKVKYKRRIGKWY